MNPQELLPYFSLLQKACLPGIWSKGVALARDSAVTLVKQESDSEFIFQVRVSDRVVSPKVTLWPEDEDWFCDCQDRNEVCAHVAAAVIALKGGLVSDKPVVSRSAQLQYRFSRVNGRLSFDRYVVFGENAQILSGSLVAFIGGVNSGRITSPPLAVTRDDYAVDMALNEKSRGELERAGWLALFKGLASCPGIFLDREPVAVSAKPLKISAELVDEGSGFRLQQKQENAVEERFANGVVLSGNVLCAVDVPALTVQQREWLGGSGTHFSKDDLKQLVLEVLPGLQGRIPIEIQTKKLPQVKRASSRVVLHLEKNTQGDMTVIPRLQVGDGKTSLFAGSTLLISDPEEERSLGKRLQNELHLNLGQRVTFAGDAAVDFLLNLKGWETSGPGVKEFSLFDPLVPNLSVSSEESGLTGTMNFSSLTGDFQIQFSAPGGSGNLADPNAVFRAWRENKSYVPLLQGGWAPLPKDWMARYADQVEELLTHSQAAKKEKKDPPKYLLLQAVQIFQEMGQPYPAALKNLVESLNGAGEIPTAPLPSDLNASLRPYQITGVNWLCFLRNAKMGAMLADDMGLGKTLQALCAIQGKTLVICPTSVLFSWAKQVELFRPQMKYSIYHGPQRKLSSSDQLVITSYAVARIDRELLNQQNWNSIVLDEAQVIKNPDSLTTRAIHSYQADFKLALSGTPLENRLEDLWSQFQFINPGLLGSLESFQDRFSGPMGDGDRQAAERLRTRVKPFILRRLKREVAEDLPARTETVLHAELSETERDLYNALLVSTQKEVLEKLEAEVSVFAVLELLLRLRQACCHPALLPQAYNNALSSSKVSLLVETLTESIACGHRALVFSQWTAYLDLIEKALSQAGITYSRLDGSTKNRGELVDEFQKDSGPSVMLISLKAGGVGLTLTAADHIFLMDPWWNPAVEDQAADRAHRIGQTNPVLVHRLIAKDTIEERILELQKSKKAMAASVLGEPGGAAASTITRQDLLALLN